MSNLCDNGNDPFAGISMPREVSDLLRCRLTVIQRSTAPLQVHLLSERAQGVIEALEVLKVLNSSELESLYLIIENASQARVKELL